MNEQHTSFKGLISVGNRVIIDMRIVLSYLNMSACHQMDVGKVNIAKKENSNQFISEYPSSNSIIQAEENRQSHSLGEHCIDREDY